MFCCAVSGVDSPGSALNRPGSHGRHASASVAAPIWKPCWPAGQGTHLQDGRDYHSTCTAELLAARTRGGSSPPLPPSTVPRCTCAHAAAASVTLHCTAFPSHTVTTKTHVWHAESPGTPPYVPGAQGRHAAALVAPSSALNVPAGHTVHAPSEIAPARPDHVPDGQFSQYAAPARENVPAGQIPGFNAQGARARMLLWQFATCIAAAQSSTLVGGPPAHTARHNVPHTDGDTAPTAVEK